MSTLIKRSVLVVLVATLALTAIWPVLVQAREIESLEDMKAAVKENMPAFLNEPRDVVGQLLEVSLSPPLSRSFDQKRAIKAIFGSRRVSLSKNCQSKTSPVGEANQDECIASIGLDTGKGAYTQLTFSNNMGNGNINFLRRSLVDDNMTLDKLPTAKLSQDAALKQAMGFLSSAFGLPMKEIPLPPLGAKGSLVRNLAVAGGDASGERIKSLVIQKVVTVQRGFQLARPYVDEITGRALTHVRGPGKAMVAVDDTGVVGATVEGWQELRKDPRVTAKNAKSVEMLTEEIAEDLFNNGVRQFERMHFAIQVSADWRGTYGLLVPVVQVTITMVPNDLNEDQQAKLAFKSTAGLIKEYSLLDRADVDTRE